MYSYTTGTRVLYEGGVLLLLDVSDMICKRKKKEEEDEEEAVMT